jgi:hypothetical protein
MNKQPVLDQINALIVTMGQVKLQEGALEMSTWIDQDTEGKDPEESRLYCVEEEVHFCNAVACICGYQALSNRLEAFPQAEYDAYEKGESKLDVADSLGDSMFKIFTELFGNSDLAESIYQSRGRIRLSSAACSGLFTEDEIAKINHLNLDTPSVDDVLEYLNLCKEKVEAL